jgi:hypothetical protein
MDMLPPYTESKNPAAFADFLLGLLFDPKDGGNLFLRNVAVSAVLVLKLSSSYGTSLLRFSYDGQRPHQSKTPERILPSECTVYRRKNEGSPFVSSPIGTHNECRLGHGFRQGSKPRTTVLARPAAIYWLEWIATIVLKRRELLALACLRDFRSFGKPEIITDKSSKQQFQTRLNASVQSKLKKEMSDSLDGQGYRRKTNWWMFRGKMAGGRLYARKDTVHYLQTLLT